MNTYSPGWWSVAVTAYRPPSSKATTRAGTVTSWPKALRAPGLWKAALTTSLHAWAARTVNRTGLPAVDTTPPPPLLLLLLLPSGPSTIASRGLAPVTVTVAAPVVVLVLVLVQPQPSSPSPPPRPV